MDFLKNILEIILGLIFPEKCTICGKAGKYLCIDCIADIPAAERETEKWIFPVFDYRHPNIKKALWFFKYSGKRRLAKIFAEILYEKIQEEISEAIVLENFNKPILIPIPISKKRSRERGYNQASLICRELMKITENRKGLVLDLNENILERIKDLEHQALIHDRKRRLKNIIESFSVKNPETIKNRNIVLIDDITTTGATLTEARKMLKEAGARKILAFTVAH
jgi:ComF family protein